MNNYKITVIILLSAIILSACFSKTNPENETRNFKDTIGFAKYAYQMDSIIVRMKYDEVKTDSNEWKLSICPHDDYVYVGNLYPKALKGIKAKTVILFGVAHKAKKFDLADKIIFDSFESWEAPYGKVPVSELRQEILSKLPDSLFVVHDQIQSIEHSLEAIIPFLQYQNPDTEIIPILVPYMQFNKMQEIAASLSNILANIMEEKKLNWGEDISIVISNDAVHYGDEDWGGKDMAPFGTDSAGTQKARNLEMEIINKCLAGELTQEKIKSFTEYTVQESDYKEYKWVWCGRYSVPFGLSFAFELDKKLNGHGIHGNFIDYSTSIDTWGIPVRDLGMGETAPANIHHWVGYAVLGYK